jgi:hypothetical protein
MTNTYWNSNGKYQSQYIELSKLVPYSGKCESVEGELIRSLCKVYYDYYNNKMCNNTSGACNYIRSKLEMPADVMNALIEIYHESNTGCYTSKDLSQSLELLADFIISYVDSKNGNYIANTQDMLDFSDEDEMDNDIWDDYEEEEEYEFED